MIFLSRDILQPPPGVKPVIPTGVRQIKDWEKTSEKDRKMIRLLIGRQYNRLAYWKDHDKTRAYQRAYQKAYQRRYVKSKRLKADEAELSTERPSIREVFTIADIMQSPMGSTARMIDSILSGARGLAL